ncbi:hypothetical protein GCM10011611_63840 [Aliidongia dinghuensis]|uniref:Uncharacterized protein n=1 Tax=Aliidongia dinghuensis TaxID=1867774 RepID=A0A8J2Z022_9PROT|nr:hypothetical protein [Aliidongia dinghuensis]GGF48673.1 hypothetical protein GCM10011611_63840 [Aliidongia dinghuensis]
MAIGTVAAETMPIGMIGFADAATMAPVGVYANPAATALATMPLATTMSVAATMAITATVVATVSTAAISTAAGATTSASAPSATTVAATTMRKGRRRSEEDVGAMGRGGRRDRGQNADYHIPGHSGHGSTLQSR